MTVKDRPMTAAMARAAKPEAMGTKRRPPKKARYSGSLRFENRL
jgi:hypothetical protein